MVNCVAVCGLRRWMCSAACEKNNPQQYLLFCKKSILRTPLRNIYQQLFFFIEPRSDHWIALSLSHSINQPSPFVKVVTFNCQSFYMNLSTVLYIFDKLATYICLRKSSYMYLSKPSYVFLALCEGKPSCLVWFGFLSKSIFLCACKFKHDCVMMKLKLSKSTQSSFN